MGRRRAVRRVEFVVEGNPIPKGRPRVVLSRRPDRYRAHAFTPPQTKAWERVVGWAARRAMDGREPLRGDLAVVLEFFRQNAIACDLDNLAKAITDALNGICYHDDRQIVEMVLYRMIDAENPRVQIQIIPLEDGT